MTYSLDLRVKAAWDQDPLADSDRILAYTPASGQQYHITGYGSVYVHVNAVSDVSRGQPRFDGYGARSFVGREQRTYVSPHVHRNTVANLISDLEGQVTAYLTGYSSTYAYYNCYLRFEVERNDTGAGQEWLKLTWIFTIVEAL